MIIRYRRSVGEERAQLRWAAGRWCRCSSRRPSAACSRQASRLALDAVATSLFVVALAVAILRYRLYDIDFVINRTLVYLLLSGCIVVAYVGVVAALGAIFQAKASVVISLIATGLVAAAFSPLRMRLQRSVDHLMYGERDQPYEVLARLGNRLAAATVAEEVLPSVAETVAEAMRVPYVAVEMASEDGLSTIVAHGRPVDNALRLPLVHHGAQVGDLVVGPRGPNESFSAAIASCSTTSRDRPPSPCTQSPSPPISVVPASASSPRGRRSAGDSAATSTTGSDPTLAAIAVRAEAAKPCAAERSRSRRRGALVDRIGRAVGGDRGAAHRAGPASTGARRARPRRSDPGARRPLRRAPHHRRRRARPARRPPRCRRVRRLPHRERGAHERRASLGRVPRVGRHRGAARSRW